MKATKITSERKRQQVAFDVMARAIGKYIKSMGGTALVVGGVKIGQEPFSLAYNYFIQIGITGQRPTKKNL